MPGIKIHDDNSPMQGAVLFLNASVKAYLDNNKDRKNETKFKELNQMMQNDLYLTDLRPATESNKHDEFDLVGFSKNGEPVCFSFRTDPNLQIKQFKTTAFNNLSEASQEMAIDIQKSLGLEQSSHSPTM